MSFQMAVPGEWVHMGCGIERILIAYQVIDRNFCREGSHTEDVPLCHFRIHDGGSPAPGKMGGKRSFVAPCHRVTSGLSQHLRCCESILRQLKL